MKRVLLIVAASGAAIFALWGVLIYRRPSAPEVTHPTTVEKIAPQRIQVRVRGASDVEAVLVDPDQSSFDPGHPPPRDSVIKHYWIRSPAVRLDPAQRSELIALLLDPRSYQNESPTCTFHPNVSYRFLAPAETLDVLVCHGCSQIHFVETDSSGSGGTALPVGDRLRVLTQALFPRDSVIAAEVRQDAIADSVERANRPWWSRLRD